MTHIIKEKIEKLVHEVQVSSYHSHCHNDVGLRKLFRTPLQAIYQAGQEDMKAEVVKVMQQFPSMDVDEYVAIIKAGNWDKMYEAGVRARDTALQTHLQAPKQD